MPTCPACAGTGQQWVDWAETYADCLCQSGEISESKSREHSRREEKYRRKRLKMSRPQQNNSNYQIQEVSVTWSDYDTIASRSWKTVRVVETLQFALHLLEQMNNEGAEFFEHGLPYRLVHNGQVLNQNGDEVGQAINHYRYWTPDE